MIIAGFLKISAEENKYAPAILVNGSLLCLFLENSEGMTTRVIDSSEVLLWTKYDTWDLKAKTNSSPNVLFYHAKEWLRQQCDAIREEECSLKDGDSLLTTFSKIELEDYPIDVDSSKIKMAILKEKKTIDLDNLNM